MRKKEISPTQFQLNINNQRGFTLIELLVVIAIIGLLASVVLVSLNGARDKSRVAATAVQLRQLQRVTAMFLDDTGQMPAACRLDCTALTDPFLNSLGVVGWRGPYARLYNMADPWGGHIGFQVLDWDGDGTLDYGFILDDDKPGTDGNNNGGAIPLAQMVEIDKILDDGNLATGQVRGNGLGFGSALGEMVMAFHQ